MKVKNNEVLGQIIKRQRILEGYTQVQASKICRVSASQLSRVERGLCFPSAKCLVRIARPLNINESVLLTCAAYLAADGREIAGRSLIELSQALRSSLAKNLMHVSR